MHCNWKLFDCWENCWFWPDGGLCGVSILSTTLFDLLLEISSANCSSLPSLQLHSVSWAVNWAISTLTIASIIILSFSCNQTVAINVDKAADQIDRMLVISKYSWTVIHYKSITKWHLIMIKLSFSYGNGMLT